MPRWSDAISSGFGCDKPAAASLAAVAWLLTLHDAASGRVYGAYGGANMGVEIFWLRLVDGVRPSAWDIAGVAVALAATQATLHSSRVGSRSVDPVLIPRRPDSFFEPARTGTTMCALHMPTLESRPLRREL